MKIAICDDMELYRKDIIDAIDSKKLLGDFVEYTEFDSAEALLVAYETTKYDVIFLDVEMAKLNGIDAGIQIRNKNNKTIIIFVSSYPHYSIPAYECEPLYYLTKPFKNNDLTKVFNKISKNVNSGIIIPNTDENKLIEFDIVNPSSPFIPIKLLYSAVPK